MQLSTYTGHTFYRSAFPNCLKLKFCYGYISLKSPIILRIIHAQIPPSPLPTFPILLGLRAATAEAATEGDNDDKGDGGVGFRRDDDSMTPPRRHRYRCLFRPPATPLSSRKVVTPPPSRGDSRRWVRIKVSTGSTFTSDRPPPLSSSSSPSTTTPTSSGGINRDGVW